MKWRGPFGQGSASGKLGALVASRNRGGQYLRSRVTPVNPSTTFQQAVRNALRSLVSLWTSTLTDEQRNGWETYGSNVTVTDSLGDARTRTGQNWFIGNNTPRLQSGIARVDDAPNVFNQGDTGDAVFDMTSDTAGSLTLGTAPDGWSDSTNSQTLMLYISRPINASRNFLKLPTQLVGTLSNVAVSPPAGGAFTLPFPNSGADVKVAFYYRIAREDGRLSGPFRGASAGF
jgi:hypothetical protein